MRGSHDKDEPGHPTNSSGSLYVGVGGGGGGMTQAELGRDHAAVTVTHMSAATPGAASSHSY